MNQCVSILSLCFLSSNNQFSAVPEVLLLNSCSISILFLCAILAFHTKIFIQVSAFLIYLHISPGIWNLNDENPHNFNSRFWFQVSLVRWIKMAISVTDEFHTNDIIAFLEFYQEIFSALQFIDLILATRTSRSTTVCIYSFKCKMF